MLDIFNYIFAGLIGLFYSIILGLGFLLAQTEYKLRMHYYIIRISTIISMIIGITIEDIELTCICNGYTIGSTIISILAIEYDNELESQENKKARGTSSDLS